MLKIRAGLMLDKIPENVDITISLYNYRTKRQVNKNLSFSYVCKVCCLFKIIHYYRTITGLKYGTQTLIHQYFERLLKNTTGF
jgi:hypothetical protein